MNVISVATGASVAGFVSIVAYFLVRMFSRRSGFWRTPVNRKVTEYLGNPEPKRSSGQ